MSIGVASKQFQAIGKLASQSALALFFVSITHSLTGEPPALPEGELSHSLNNLELTLDNKNKHCQLQARNNSSEEAKLIPLLLEAPCYWIVSSKTKALLQYNYESVSADNTLLVAGNALDWSTDQKSYQKLPNDSYCTQYLQGVVISKDQAYAVDEKMVAAHCETGLAIDEKIFYAMAHNPKRYQEKTVVSETTDPKPTQTDKTTKPLAEVKPEDTEKTEEKSFLDSVTDSVKNFFSGEAESEK